MNQLRATVNELELNFNEKRKKFKYEFELEKEKNMLDKFELMGDDGVGGDFTNLSISKRGDVTADVDGVQLTEFLGRKDENDASLLKKKDKQAKWSAYNQATATATKTKGGTGETTDITHRVADYQHTNDEFKRDRFLKNKEKMITDLICAVPDNLQIDMRCQNIPNSRERFKKWLKEELWGNWARDFGTATTLILLIASFIFYLVAIF